MQAKVGPCASSIGLSEQRGRLFELGGLKLKGSQIAKLDFRSGELCGIQLETWTSSLSVSQTISRNAFLLILMQSISDCMHVKTGTIIADRRRCCCC